MQTALSSLSLVDPSTVDRALQYLRDDPSLMPIAGCTDVFVGLNAGAVSSRRFLNLWRLDELRGIRLVGEGVLQLGALSTYTDVIASPLVTARLPMLSDSARQIGAVQIHHRGTIGGNVANASPAGDTLPVFAAADAIVVLRSIENERRVAFTAFYTGYRTSVRRPDELIYAIEVPPITGPQWFRKVGTRAAQSISKVVMAATRTPSPRIALGSVAPTVVRARRTEEALACGADVRTARTILDQEIAPIDDFRSTAAYRRAVAGNLLEQFWRETT